MNTTHFKSQIDIVKKSIQDDILTYFHTIDYNTRNKDIQIVKINKLSDFDNVYTGRGFYVILTDFNVGENQCNFKRENLTAIYRGHSYTVRKRLLSHLLHKDYKNSNKENEVTYRVCLKVQDGVNGINISELPYSNSDWVVIIFKMRGSDVLMREQAEKAFDIKYSMPLCSKESKKK